MIKNISVTILKNIVFKSLTPSIFITLNSGDLVSIYSSKDLLPTSINKLKKFIQFIKNNLILCKLFDVNFNDILKLKENTIKTLRNQNTINKLKKIILLYKIFTSYTNFIKSMYNENEIINYKHYLDFFSRKNNNLFPYGLNILIFNNKTKNLMCNPYLVKSNDVVLLVKETNKQFTPIYHIRVNSNGNISGNYGTFRINKYINLENKNFKKLKNKNINIKIF